MDTRKKKYKASVRVVIIFLIGYKMILYFLFDFNCINNQAEYNALIIGLEIILELRA
jgi:ribonuclease HI